MWDRKEKKFLCILFSIPFVWMIYSLFSGRYFPDPAEPFMTISGIWASVFLCLSLSVTPLAQRFKKLKVLNRYRRFIGVSAFWYALVHFFAYLILHAGFNISWIIEDLIKRPYIYLGVLAFVILLVLAITSFKVCKQKIGRYWKKLHKLVYLSAILVAAHLWWQVKADYEIAFWLSVFLFFPLVFRLIPQKKK